MLEVDVAVADCWVYSPWPFRSIC